jgi:hypothetical protein
VADVRDEVATHALDPPQDRDVVERQHEAAGPERHRVDRELARTERPEIRLASDGAARR